MFRNVLVQDFRVTQLVDFHDLSELYCRQTHFGRCDGINGDTVRRNIEIKYTRDESQCKEKLFGSQ